MCVMYRTKWKLASKYMKRIEKSRVEKSNKEKMQISIIN